MSKQFDIQVKLPGGKTATFMFFADDENDIDLNFVFDALDTRAWCEDRPRPKLIERTEKIIK